MHTHTIHTRESFLFISRVTHITHFLLCLHLIYVYTCRCSFFLIVYSCLTTFPCFSQNMRLIHFHNTRKSCVFSCVCMFIFLVLSAPGIPDVNAMHIDDYAHTQCHHTAERWINCVCLCLERKKTLYSCGNCES